MLSKTAFKQQELYICGTLLLTGPSLDRIDNEQVSSRFFIDISRTKAAAVPPCELRLLLYRLTHFTFLALLLN